MPRSLPSRLPWLFGVCLLAVSACGGGGGNADADPDPGATGQVLAPAAEPCALGDLPSEALVAVNALRAQTQVCNGVAQAAVARLAWDDQLALAAAGHSADMARNGFLGHIGSDGSTPSQRVSAAGVSWSWVAENVSSGHSTLDAVLAGWMNSPGHCLNLMSPEPTRMALSCHRREGGADAPRWALVLSRP